MHEFKVGDLVRRKRGAGKWYGFEEGQTAVVNELAGKGIGLAGFNTTFSPGTLELVKRTATVTPYEAQQMLGQAGGLKFDAGKEQWDLLLSVKGMLAAVRGVLAVLGFGAKKYAAHSWREVEDNERRYLDGLMRHYVEIKAHGLHSRDQESGLLHIDHLNCNGLFLGELARKKENPDADQA